MVNSVPPLPRFKVEIVKKVNPKPDFKDEKRYNEQNQQANRENDRHSQKLGQKGEKVDVQI
jgi:hypothetical protein